MSVRWLGGLLVSFVSGKLDFMSGPGTAHVPFARGFMLLLARGCVTF